LGIDFPVPVEFFGMLEAAERDGFGRDTVDLLTGGVFNER
jgi:hypothetical protein